MAHGDFKHLPGRTTSDKILIDKICNIDKNLKYDEYHQGLASVVFLIKKKVFYACKYICCS